MSYVNPSSPSVLANKGWRRRHSAWLLAVVFGMGLLSFVGFLYCAMRVRTYRWWIRAAVTSALTAVGWVLMTLFVESTEDATGSIINVDRPGPADDLATGFVVALWISMVIYGLVINREYLRWRAGQVESGEWYHQPGEGPLSAMPAPAKTIHPPTSTSHAPLLDVDTGSYYAPATPTPSDSPDQVARHGASGSESRDVDINSADAATIASGVGLDASTAARLVSARDQRRGFQSFDEAAFVVGLQPHELLRMRRKATLGDFRPAAASPTAPAPEEPNPPTKPRSGRILDY